MNKKYTIIIVLFFWIASFNQGAAQEQMGLREHARKYYKEYKYFQASQLLQRLVDVKKPFLSDMELLADCYRRMKNYELAENWYSRVVNQPKAKAENLFRYGEVLMSNLKYNEAKAAFQQYVKNGGDQQRVINNIAGCDSSLVWLAHPTLHTLKNEESINTKLSEFSVFPYQQKVFYAGEPDTALFKSIYGRTGNPYLRIYTADRMAKTLNNPDIDRSSFNNGKYHIGPVSTNKDGSVLFITRTTTGEKVEIDEEDHVKYLTNNLELYVFKKNGEQWQSSAFPYNNVEKYSVGHASLSDDGKVLYFVSDMPGGVGGTDIWYCELQPDGSWGKPQNAGAMINTSKDEMFPYAGIKGKLYFSSNGWPGMGGLDIFVADGARQNWSKALNLKYPLNSPGDDFGYIVFSDHEDEATGYLSSNRKNGKGGDDIYSFTFKKPETRIMLAVKGMVSDRKTNQTIGGVNVTLYSGNQVLSSVKNDANGVFFFTLEKDKDYNLTAKKDKFDTDTKTISTRGLRRSDTLMVDLKIGTLFEVGKVFTLKNINYDFDKDNIRPDAAKILDGLVDIMRDNPTLEIELGSHTDSRGKDSYNLALSQRRAQSVVNYLVAKGISRARMIAKGYGETQLLNGCDDGVPCSEEQHQENRRTVFKVMKY